MPIFRSDRVNAIFDLTRKPLNANAEYALPDLYIPINRDKMGFGGRQSDGSESESLFTSQQGYSAALPISVSGIGLLGENALEYLHIISGTQGTISMFFKPAWNGNDGKDYTLIASGLWVNDGMFYTPTNSFSASGVEDGVWQYLASVWDDVDSLYELYVSGTLTASDLIGSTGGIDNMYHVFIGRDVDVNNRNYINSVVAGILIDKIPWNETENEAIASGMPQWYSPEYYYNSGAGEEPICDVTTLFAPAWTERENKRLVHPAQFKATLIEDATDTTIRVSEADAERLKKYADNFPSDQVRCLVCKPDSTGETAGNAGKFETFVLDSSNIAQDGTITVSPLQHEENYKVISGAYISTNLIADYDSDFSGSYCWEEVGGASIAKDSSVRRTMSCSISGNVSAINTGYKQSLNLDALENYYFTGFLRSDGTNYARFKATDDICQLITGTHINDSVWIGQDFVFATSGTNFELQVESNTDTSFGFYADALSLLPNLISGNNFFDTSLWQAKDITLSLDTNNQRNGTKCLKLVVDKDNGYLRQYVHDVEDQWYTLKYYADGNIDHEVYAIRPKGARRYGTNFKYGTNEKYSGAYKLD